MFLLVSIKSKIYLFKLFFIKNKKNYDTILHTKNKKGIIMELSYKNKLRLVSDEQFGSSFEEKENLKSILQKGLFVLTFIFSVISLSKLI